MFLGVFVMLDSTIRNPLVAVGDASSALLSDKHELFVQALMSNGGHLVDAYRAVYPNAGSNNAAYANACRLRARQDVSVRIAELTSCRRRDPRVSSAEIRLWRVAKVGRSAGSRDAGEMDMECLLTTGVERKPK